MEEKVKCPKCGSEQITALKKGFSGGKAAVGAVLTGGIGLLAGYHGSGKIEIACLVCGHKWDPKKSAKKADHEQQLKNFQAIKEWKVNFYETYEKKEFDKASEIYLSKRQFNRSAPDVHGAYLFEKKMDKYFNVVCFFILAGIIYVLWRLF